MDMNSVEILIFVFGGLLKIMTTFVLIGTELEVIFDKNENNNVKFECSAFFLLLVAAIWMPFPPIC